MAALSTHRDLTTTNCTIFYLNQASEVSEIRSVYTVTLEQGEDGYIVAKCQSLGVVTQGKTEEEAQRKAIEAIELVLEEEGKEREFNISIRRVYSA